MATRAERAAKQKPQAGDVTRDRMNRMSFDTPRSQRRIERILDILGDGKPRLVGEVASEGYMSFETAINYLKYMHGTEKVSIASWRLGRFPMYTTFRPRLGDTPKPIPRTRTERDKRKMEIIRSDPERYARWLQQNRNRYWDNRLRRKISTAKLEKRMKEIEVVIIAAVSSNGTIGCQGGIPWNIPEDFRRFRELTIGHTIIMGRKTWESLPVKPLANRRNIVLSCSVEELPGAEVFNTFEKALAAAAMDGSKVFVIGGGDIYQRAICYASTMELTIIENAFTGDTFFPQIDNAEWAITSSQECQHESLVYHNTRFERITQ